MEIIMNSGSEAVLRQPIVQPVEFQVDLNQVIAREKKKKLKATGVALLLLAPSLFFLAVFTIYPVISSFINSLYKDNLATITPVWNGFGNYVDLISDTTFLECLKNNVIVAVITVPVCILMGVGMAVFSNHRGRIGKSITRMGFIYPTFIPLVAAANIWVFIYTPIYGLLGHINPDWRFLADAKTALGAVIVMLIWKQAGYLMLFYISGLNGISNEVSEAAEIDGANGVQKFWMITWPLLEPTTMYVFILALTSAFKTVDHLYIMTKGGPGNATNLLLFYIYQTGFDYWNAGKASAITIILVAILLIITAVKFFHDDRHAYYN